MYLNPHIRNDNVNDMVTNHFVLHPKWVVLGIWCIRLLHVDFHVQFAIQEYGLNVHLM